MLCSREVVPGMIRRHGGRIVNLTSGAGVRAIPNLGAYAISKAAVIRFSEQLALELAPHGISVFPIRPGVVQTRMVESARRSVPIIQKFLDEGRDVPPEATADLVEYLATGKADSLSGCLFSVKDNWDEMVRRAAEIRSEQMYLLRVRELESVQKQ
jgi:NAD(P)-dependent dehydrogenase (short-subunit alcohol dehydrogenase family)